MQFERIEPGQWLVTHEASGEDEPITETVWVSTSNDTIEAVLAVLNALQNPDPAEVARTAAREAAKAYLAETDWYVIRWYERTIPIPDDVKARRAAAVEALNG